MGHTFELDVWRNCTKSPGETRIECASIQITLGGNDTWMEGVRESYRRILVREFLENREMSGNFSGSQGKN
jgi:hypothetical protein